MREIERKCLKQIKNIAIITVIIEQSRSELELGCHL